MPILLLGKNGQVGWELQRSLAPFGKVISFNRQECDLAYFDKLIYIIRTTKPKLIVNAGAYTNVEGAESDSQGAFAINATAPMIMAGEAKRIGAWLIHFSTDYVFDGSKDDSYVEDDLPNPLNVYGKSKLEGEEAIKNSGCAYFILRSSWVYGKHGSNFVKSIVKHAMAKPELKVVNDQFGIPTSAALIADVTAICANDIFRAFSNPTGGLFHLTAGGETTWFEFASCILDKAEKMGVPLSCKASNIIPISSSEFECKATRPLNSVLSNTKIQNVLNIQLPDWKYHKNSILTDLFIKEIWHG